MHLKSLDTEIPECVLNSADKRTVLQCEETASRAPFELQTWISYLSVLEEAPCVARFITYERAVAAIPSSEKLWNGYIKEIRQYSAQFHPLHEARRVALDVSARAAGVLQVNTELWICYIEALMDGRLYAKARQAVDLALRALPITAHDRIWDIVLTRLVPTIDAPKVSVALLRRYAKLRPGEGIERLFRYLIKAELWDDAVLCMCRALEDSEWVPEGKSTREQLWIELSEIAARHPQNVRSVDVPSLLRGGIRSAKTDVAEMWIVLAQYFARRGLFEEARNVYEEAISTVPTVRDFAVVFDAFAKLEESLVTAAMQDVEEIRRERRDTSLDEPGKDIESFRDNGVSGEDELKEAEGLLELLMARLEHLTDRRPILISDVWIRQNPHNVHEWHKRARLFKKANNTHGVVNTYTKATKTVDPKRATNGRPHTLWLAFASYYENANDLQSARRVLDKAVSDPERFQAADDLAAIWCEYAEMELRAGDPEAALAALERATTQPLEDKQRELGRMNGLPNGNADVVIGAASGNAIVKRDYETRSAAWGAWRSNRTWSFRADLCESLKRPDDVIDVYHKMLDMGIADSRNVLNAASYLLSLQLFAQAFRLYDRGASGLPWPDALNVWIVYLNTFVKRYGDRKLERARDLFEEAIKAAPAYKKDGREHPHPKLVVLYTMYADMEERYSLARRSMAVLARAAIAVRPEDRANVYRLYVTRMAELFGVPKTRPIYEDALKTLTTKEEVMEFAKRFAATETQLGEIDRARAIFMHGAQIADPRAGVVANDYWKSWHDFELAHGSEDTFRDMLRVKRSVLMRHTDVHLVTSLSAGAGTIEAAASQAASESGTPSVSTEHVPHSKEEATSGGAMAELEKKARAAILSEPVQRAADEPKEAGRTEEIDLDLDSGSDSEASSESEQSDDEKELTIAVDSQVDPGAEGSPTEPGEQGGIEANSAKSRAPLEEGLKSGKVAVVHDTMPNAVEGLVAGTDLSGKRARDDDEQQTPDSAAGTRKERIGALERFKRRRA